MIQNISIILATSEELERMASEKFINNLRWLVNTLTEK